MPDMTDVEVEEPRAWREARDRVEQEDDEYRRQGYRHGSIRNTRDVLGRSPPHRAVTLRANEGTRRSREQGPPPGVFQQPAREDQRKRERVAKGSATTKAPGLEGPWWYGTNTMPKTDEENDDQL